MKAFKKPQINRQDALNSKPLKNRDVQESLLETGEVLLSYPVRVRPWAASLIKRFGGSPHGTRNKKLQLDTLGTAVWKLIDGNRSVRDVIRVFSEQHQLHPREAEVAVTQFLRELGKRGLIGLK
ncbi:MAG: PqqD family protein [Deltaproteobacteria bacterium]|nr:PqqD family protein [Deltaproteobacteria bacterium]MBW1993163.1 PqqD family protein [Deltaproteobacteria bacterium]